MKTHTVTGVRLHQPVLSGWSYGGVIIADYIKVYGEHYIAGTNWVGAVSRLGDPLVEAHFLGDDFLALICAPGVVLPSSQLRPSH
jgi:non-heme chloroperoxidase